MKIYWRFECCHIILWCSFHPVSGERILYVARRHRMLKVWRLITCLQAKKNVIRCCNFNLKFSALKGNYINSKGRKLFHNEFNFNVFVGEITVKKIILPDTYGFYFYCLKIKRNYKWVIIIYCRMYIYDLISNICHNVIAST